MWGKTLAFIILFILVFGIIVAWIPDTFYTGDTFQDSATLEALNAASLIIYSNTGTDNMTQGYSSVEDGPSPPNWNVSLPDGEYLDVWWNQVGIYGTWVIELRHVHDVWYGGYGMIDTLQYHYTDGTPVIEYFLGSWGLQKTHLENAWDSTTNSSAFTASCDHITVSIIFKPDGGYTDIGEAFDAGYLWYGLSYEWNPDDTGFNVMSLLVNLLTFQGIGVGVPGALGGFIDSVVSALFYIAIAVVAYIIIASVIPLIPGPPDG
jgi:hypothetical protein